ncbi:hypothetical protein CC86DRAFT_271076, partial [Ophiobolus disseminans]
WGPRGIAEEAELHAAHAKGNQRHCLMNDTNAQAGQAWPDPYDRIPKSARSPWVDTMAMLITFDPEGKYDQDENCDFFSGTNRIPQALAALQLSTFPHYKAGDNMCYAVEHRDEHLPDHAPDTYTVDGNQKYNWRSIFFAAIYAQNLESPKHAARKARCKPPSKSELPGMFLMSDVIWAYWARNHPNVANLRYYFANNILNEDTLRVIAKILKDETLPDVPHWPGLRFEENESEFEALLGTPIGATIAYILIQHKAQLGIKLIKSIAIFRDDATKDQDAEVQLLFTVGDVD